MALERVNPLTILPARPVPRPAHVTTGRAAAPNREPREQPGSEQARNGRNRYRVDDAYRDYARNRNASSPVQTDSQSGGIKKISSAELLNSMIHQMGGGVTSSAKGVFVDIAV